jgi:uncharacterized protein YceH (UPF0502 family)
MVVTFSDNEARVVGCLIEKSVVTPDQYPITLNGLTNACNQKSARNPVMSLEKGAVQRLVRDLEMRHMLRTEENFKSRAEKYSQRFCNTRYSDFQFDPAQLAIVCLLLLRGPQTPGELRARSGRLHSFADNAAVEDALAGLLEFEGKPLVVVLPRTPGRKDAEYMHLFSGPIDVEAYVSAAREASPATTSSRGNYADLEQRVRRLEDEVAELRQQLAALG